MGRTQASRLPGGPSGLADPHAKPVDGGPSPDATWEVHLNCLTSIPGQGGDSMNPRARARTRVHSVPRPVCTRTHTPVGPGFLHRAVGRAPRGPPPPTVLTATIWVTPAGPPRRSARDPGEMGRRSPRTPRPRPCRPAGPRGGGVGWGGVLQSARRVCPHAPDRAGVCRVGPDGCRFRGCPQRGPGRPAMRPSFRQPSSGPGAEGTAGAQPGSAGRTPGSRLGWWREAPPTASPTPCGRGG